MTSEAIRIGYMAGREIPLAEIARQVNCSPALIRNALRLAGIKVTEECGTTVMVSLPIEPFVLDIDAVGQRHKLSREDIAKALLGTVFRGGEQFIEEVLERGGVIV
jgi:hypothetical protein